MAKKKKKAVAVSTDQTKPAVAWAFWEKHTTVMATGLMLLMLLVFYFPVWFGGQTFMPPDAVNAQCGTPFVKDALSHGIYPQWNPYVFGGMPSFASLHMAPYTDWLGQVLKLGEKALGFLNGNSPFNRLALNYLLFGMLAFLLLRDKKINGGAALMASVGLIFTPTVVAFTAFSHNTKLLTAALIPIIFLLAQRLLEKRKLSDLFLLGLMVGFQLLRAHVQICYYTMMMLGFYWIFWLIGEIRAKRQTAPLMQATAMLGVALLAGLAVSAFMHLSVWEYSHFSIRGGSGSGLAFSYATDWSFAPAEMSTFFIPSFMGFGGQTYWGGMPFTDFPLYMGLVMLALAGLALVLRREKITWFFAGLFVFSLLTAFGKHLPVLYGPMFKLLPFFNKFRIPSMINILMLISVSVLAGYGVDSLIKRAAHPDAAANKAIRRYLLGFGTIVGLLFLVLLLGKSAYLGWAARVGRNAPAAYEMALSDGLRALLLFGATWALIAFTLKKSRWAALMPFAFIVLILIDLWPVNNRFVKKMARPRTEQPAYFAETPDVAFLKQQEKPFRIMPFNDSRSANWYMYHFIENINGYHAAKLKNYQRFIERFTVGGNMPKNYIQQTAQGMGLRNPATLTPADVKAQTAFFNMMNIRYLVSPLPLDQLDSTLTMVVAPRARGQNGVFAHRDALDRVWFPKTAMVLEEDEATLQYLASGAFDPAETAVLKAALPGVIGDVSQNSARVTAFDIHGFTVEAEVKQAGLMVLSEIYYPAGWHATVDGKPAEILQANYLLRALWLEPGRHEIEMQYKSNTFTMGFWISVGTLLLLLVGAGVAWRWERKAIKQSETV